MSEKSIWGSTPWLNRFCGQAALRTLVFYGPRSISTHHAQSDETNVTRPLAVAKKTALDTVGTGHVAQLGSGDSGTTVVVRVQTQHNAFAVLEVPRHPFDRVGIDVRRGHLDGSGKVNNQLALRRGLKRVGNGVANIDGIVELGASVRFRRVLVVDLRVGGDFLSVFEAPESTLDRDGLDTFTVLLEDDTALQGRGRVVDVDNGLLAALQRLERALDERFTALETGCETSQITHRSIKANLNEDLDNNVVRNEVLVDEHPHKVELGLTGRREADFDFLVSHLDKQLEHALFLLGRHGVDQLAGGLRG